MYEDLDYTKGNRKMNFTAMKILDQDGKPDYYDGEDCPAELKKILVNFYKQRQSFKLDEMLKKTKKLRRFTRSRGSRKKKIRTIKNRIMKRSWRNIDKFLFKNKR